MTGLDLGRDALIEVPALVPQDLLRPAGQGARAPGPGRHQGEHPGAGVLPAYRVRPGTGAGRGRRQGGGGGGQRPVPDLLTRVSLSRSTGAGPMWLSWFGVRAWWL